MCVFCLLYSEALCYVVWSCRALSGLRSPVVSKGPLDGHSLPCHPPTHPSTYTCGTVPEQWSSAGRACSIRKAINARLFSLRLRPSPPTAAWVCAHDSDRRPELAEGGLVPAPACAGQGSHLRRWKEDVTRQDRKPHVGPRPGPLLLKPVDDRNWC